MERLENKKVFDSLNVDSNTWYIVDEKKVKFISADDSQIEDFLLNGGVTDDFYINDLDRVSPLYFNMEYLKNKQAYKSLVDEGLLVKGTWYLIAKEQMQISSTDKKDIVNFLCKNNNLGNYYIVQHGVPKVVCKIN